MRKLITKLHLDKFIAQDLEKREAENYKSDPISLRADRLESDDPYSQSPEEILNSQQIILDLSDKLKQYEGYIRPSEDDIISESEEVYELNSKLSTSKISSHSSV